MSGQLDSLYPTSKARQIEFLPGDYVREINEHPLWGEVCRTEEFDGLWYGRLDREMRVGVKMSITEGVVDLSPATLTKVDADEYHRRLDWIRNYYQPLANLASYVGR